MFTLIWALALVVVILAVAVTSVGWSVRVLRREVTALADKLTAEMSRIRNETREEREARETGETERRQKAKEEAEQREKDQQKREEREREARQLQASATSWNTSETEQDCRCHSPGDTGCTWK